jgi:photosystem II stability/assembly factor-like uncharacterized protein
VRASAGRYAQNARVVGFRRGDTDARSLAPGDVALLVLALVTAVLVARTLRTTPPPALAAASGPAPGVTAVTGTPVGNPPGTPSSGTGSAAPSPAAADATTPTRGAVAVSGTTLLRWAGNPCAAGVPDTSVERSVDGGATWQPHPVPLVTVTSLTFTGATATASGLGGQGCTRAYAESLDGGVTWRAVTPKESVLTEAAGPPFAAAKDGCVVNDVGPATLVAVAGESAAWLVCQHADGGSRLLLRTRDAGATWQRLAGRRAETGLASDGFVEQVGFAPGAGWALIRGTRCATGDLRTSADLGAHWVTRPCVDVQRVLAVAFGDARRGVLLGVRGGAVVLLRTSDGGRSWSA